MSIVKSQILAELANNYPNFLRNDLKKSLNLVFNEIIKSLAKDQRVEIRFFGSFGVKQLKARIGRNPKNGSKIEIPERKSIRWKMSKKLKIKINE